MILSGDHIYKMDYGAMLAEHVENNADVTVGCIEVPIAKASAFGVMTTSNTKTARVMQIHCGRGILDRIHRLIALDQLLLCRFL